MVRLATTWKLFLTSPYHCERLLFTSCSSTTYEGAWLQYPCGQIDSNEETNYDKSISWCEVIIFPPDSLPYIKELGCRTSSVHVSTATNKLNMASPYHYMNSSFHPDSLYILRDMVLVLKWPDWLQNGN